MPRPRPASIPGHPRWVWKSNRWALGPFSIRPAVVGGYDLVRAGNPPVLWESAPYLTPQLAATAGEQALTRGRGAHGPGSRARRREQFRDVVGSGQCDDRGKSPVYYHVTWASRLPEITRRGLLPAGRHEGPQSFDDPALRRHSTRKLFLAVGADAAYYWTAHAIWGPRAAEDHLVVLRVDPALGARLRPEFDSWGADVHPCSAFVRRALPAKSLALLVGGSLLYRPRFAPLIQSTGRAARRLRGKLRERHADPGKFAVLCREDASAKLWRARAVLAPYAEDHPLLYHLAGAEQPPGRPKVYTPLVGPEIEALFLAARWIEQAEARRLGERALVHRLDRLDEQLAAQMDERERSADFEPDPSEGGEEEQEEVGEEELEWRRGGEPRRGGTIARAPGGVLGRGWDVVAGARTRVRWRGKKPTIEEALQDLEAARHAEATVRMLFQAFPQRHWGPELLAFLRQYVAEAGPEAAFFDSYSGYRGGRWGARIAWNARLRERTP